jgi:hypothetical protein
MISQAVEQIIQIRETMRKCRQSFKYLHNQYLHSKTKSNNVNAKLP